MSEIKDVTYTENRVHAGMSWLGPEDSVGINVIRQTPGTPHVITALHHAMDRGWRLAIMLLPKNIMVK